MTGADFPRVDFVEERLTNGLRVVLHRNSRVPLVHISVHYCVGSSDEEPGLSGLAHLFEHMMFQGSESVAKNEHGRMVDEAGGSWNASTGKDRTNYYQTLPSHYLELGLWLEADRMRALEVTDENFENQRQTVIEEKKQSYDNQPYGLSHLRFDALAYSNWAYGHPIIGAVEDLERATVEEARCFHSRFYRPGNAVLTLAGDFELARARPLVEKHFGSIPDRPGPKRMIPEEPLQKEEKFEEMADPLASLPGVAIGFHMPRLDSPEYYALAMLAQVLADGDSSRFYRRFVYDNNWITGLFAGPNQYRGPGMFRIWFQVQQGVDPDAVCRAVEEELDRVSSSLVGSQELEKARNQVAHRFVSRLSRVAQVGELLAQSVSMLGRADVANEQLDCFLAVTSADLREVSSRTFRTSNRTTIRIQTGART